MRTLDHCITSGNDRISAVALQQIALHLSDGVSDLSQRQRLIKCLPNSRATSSVPATHRPILATIKNLLSVDETHNTPILPANDLDILYPCYARFLDLRREFRDSTHYLIDGDSLLLSVAHHINVNLVSYHGNTLHVIFIIERILLTLFNQNKRCNYTILFFDCHHQFYQQERSILSLIRSCLIAHLSKNVDKCRVSPVQQFPSWLDPSYVKFVREEKPHFVFYHDTSGFKRVKNPLLSERALEQLHYVYRLFGMYHQDHLGLHVYLMNKLILTETSVKCFQVIFENDCSKRRMERAIQASPSYRRPHGTANSEWMNFESEIVKQIDQDDVRIFLYTKTILDLIKKKAV